MMKDDSAHIAEATRLRMQLMTMTRRLRQQASQDVLPFGLLAVLGAIDRAGGEATPTELARGESLRSSNLAGLLRELEGGGLIRRLPDPEDGRRVRVQFVGGRRRGLAAQSPAARWLAAGAAGWTGRRDRALLLRAGALLERLARED